MLWNFFHRSSVGISFSDGKSFSALPRAGEESEAESEGFHWSEGRRMAKDINSEVFVETPSIPAKK